MNNPHLLPVAERQRYNLILDLKYAISGYKAARTVYNKKPSAYADYYLRRAEHRLVCAARTAASVVIDRNQ